MNTNSDQALIDRIEIWRPITASSYCVEAKIARPKFHAEIRRICWDNPIKTTTFTFDTCYLELALKPRPNSPELDYLRLRTTKAFSSIGNCCFVPAGHTSEIRNAIGEHQVIACFFEIDSLKPYIDWEWTPLHLAACLNINNINVQQILLALAQEAVAPRYMSHALSDARFECLLVELSRHIRAVTAHNEKPHNLLSNKNLGRIESEILNSNGEFPSVTALARLCKMSSRNLSRLFKATTGKTIQEYIFDTKISRAKLALTSPQPIKTVAYECGFKSTSAFTQAFRKATGITPSEYHRNYLRQSGEPAI